MNAVNAQIGEWLGVQTPATEAEILRIVEGQLAPAVFRRLISLGLERDEIDAIIIPQRTLQHRRFTPRKANHRGIGSRATCHPGFVAC